MPANILSAEKNVLQKFLLYAETQIQSARFAQITRIGKEPNLIGSYDRAGRVIEIFYSRALRGSGDEGEICRIVKSADAEREFRVMSGQVVAGGETR